MDKNHNEMKPLLGDTPLRLSSSSGHPFVFLLFLRTLQGRLMEKMASFI